MDSEEERVLYLARVGNEKIFKYGTYTVVQDRAVTQDHPFYVKREDGLQKISYIPPQQANAVPEPAAAEPMPAPEPAAPPAPESEPDPEALAAQVMSSNFKVGLSQAEVDALLNGMT